MAPLPFAYNWTGFYVGINGGGGWGRSTQTDAAGVTSGSYNQSGGLVGGTVGYNWQMTNWVLGLEADWDWANIDGSTNPVVCAAPGCFTDLRSIGTVRPRLGYAWDRWLVYVTGGLAWGDIKAGQDSCTPSTPLRQQHRTRLDHRRRHRGFLDTEMDSETRIPLCRPRQSRLLHTGDPG